MSRVYLDYSDIGSIAWYDGSDFDNDVFQVPRRCSWDDYDRYQDELLGLVFDAIHEARGLNEKDPW